MFSEQLENAVAVQLLTMLPDPGKYSVRSNENVTCTLAEKPTLFKL